MFNQYIVRLGFNPTTVLNPTTLLPPLTVVCDGQGYSGFATTYQDGRNACLGELIERKHFFHEVPVHRVGPMHQYGSKSFGQAFETLVRQTAKSGPLTQALDSYAFEWTSCINLATWEPAYIPTILISLGKSRDAAWIPDRDSSGCASHSDPQRTLETALLEFLERQNLTSWWLAERSRYRITLEDRERYLPPALQGLINKFMEVGSLFIVNSSLFFDCYSIVAIFIAHADREHVKFSIGSACCLDPYAALEKALYELCQSFALMAEVHQRGDSGAYQRNRGKYGKLTQNFCDVNQREIITEFPHISTDSIPSLSLQRYLAQPTIKLESLLEALSKLSDNIFYYSSMFSLADQACFFGRVASPDFFVGMDNQAESFNLYNRFSERLNLKQNKAKSLPFA